MNKFEQPHYDSLLVKCTVSGTTYEVARRKMLRALVEFRIRGVKTNIPFLFRLLTHDIFIGGKTWTTVCPPSVGLTISNILFTVH